MLCVQFLGVFILINVVCSYSHEDENYCTKLVKHLKIMESEGLINTWHDRKIEPGQVLEEEIEEAFSSADIILLLISSDFFNSDYCCKTEMPKALKRHEERKSIVIPVILRSCDWKESPIRTLLAVPTDGKPLSQFSNIDDGLLQVVDAVKKARTVLLQWNKESGKRITSSSNNTNSKVKSSLNSPNTFITRSKNLEIRKNFTDRDYELALKECIRFLGEFFTNSLAELSNSNGEIDYDIDWHGNDRFECKIYENGRGVSHCHIWRLKVDISQNEIRYYSGEWSMGAFNYSMAVGSDGRSIGFKVVVGRIFDDKPVKLLNQVDVAEYFWANFIEPLQK